MTYKIFVPNVGYHPVDMQKWCKENRIYHFPTEKMTRDNQDGWVFTFEDEKDAMAFKLKWT